VICSYSALAAPAAASRSSELEGCNDARIAGRTKGRDNLMASGRELRSNDSGNSKT